jgi:hypothetical protein
MNDKSVEINIRDVHCTILFLPEDNPHYKEEILRILSCKSERKVNNFEKVLIDEQ